MENIRKFKCQSVMPTRANIYLLEDQKERRQFMDIKSHRDNRKKISKKKKKLKLKDSSFTGRMKRYTQRENCEILEFQTQNENHKISSHGDKKDKK